MSGGRAVRWVWPPPLHWGGATGEAASEPGMATPLPRRQGRRRGRVAVRVGGERGVAARLALRGGARDVGRSWPTLQPQVLVLLADAAQLHLQLLDATPLRLQELLLALDDVVELQQVLHCPVRALRAALARFHGQDLRSKSLQPWARIGRAASS